MTLFGKLVGSVSRKEERVTHVTCLDVFLASPGDLRDCGLILRRVVTRELSHDRASEAALAGC